MTEDVRKGMIAYLEENGFDEKSAEGWFKLGGALLDENRLEEAEYAYRESLGLDPKNVNAWKDLGATHFLRNQDEEAEKAFKTGLQLDSAHADLWYNLGCVYNASDRIDEAIESFREAMKYNAEDPDILCNLGVALRASNEKEAESFLRRAIEIKQDHVVSWLNLLGLLYAMGRDEEAEKLYEEAVKLAPALRNLIDTMDDFVTEKLEEKE